MAKDEKPQDYKGPREPIVTKHPCGFCNAGDHNQCRKELAYYEKLWICPCSCNKGWVPQDLGSATKVKKRRITSEMRDMPVSGDAGQPKQVGEPSGDLPITPVPEGDGSLERWADDYDAQPSTE